MGRTGETVRTADVAIETYVDGDGPTLVILPSYGRDGGADYDDITAQAARAGWRVLRPQPRGVAGSSGPMTGVTLHDLADDVAAVVRALGRRPRRVLLGHAFGHAVSRMVATDHPDLITAVILAASRPRRFHQTLRARPFWRATCPGQRPRDWTPCAGRFLRRATMLCRGWPAGTRRRSGCSTRRRRPCRSLPIGRADRRPCWRCLALWIPSSRRNFGAS